MKNRLIVGAVAGVAAAAVIGVGIGVVDAIEATPATISAAPGVSQLIPEGIGGAAGKSIKKSVNSSKHHTGTRPGGPPSRPKK